MKFIRRWFARRRLPSASFPCPHCGGEVPGGRQSCPQCGASESDGWGDGSGDEGSEGASGGWDSEASGGWGDDSDFDYEAFVEREFAAGDARHGEFASASKRPDPKRLVLWIVIFAFAATLLLPLIL